MSGVLTTEQFQTKQSRLFKYDVSIWQRIYRFVLFFSKRSNCWDTIWHFLCIVGHLSKFLLIENCSFSVRNLTMTENMKHRPAL